jgi:lipopolysaccharide biosynthesis glycosyltransferase
MDYANQYPELCIFWDQTVMNTLLAGKFEQLPELWNQQFNGPDKSFLRDGILHYCGPDKPWNYANALPAELKELFFKEVDRTAWQGWRPRPRISFALRVARKIKRMVYGF